jgi:hypothetical protein
MRWGGRYSPLPPLSSSSSENLGGSVDSEDVEMWSDLLDGRYDEESEEAAIGSESRPCTRQPLAAQGAPAATTAAADVARAEANAAAEVARDAERRHAHIRQFLRDFNTTENDRDLEVEPQASGFVAESLPAALVSAVIALPPGDYRVSRLQNWSWNRAPIWNQSWDCCCQQQEQELQNWRRECSHHGFGLGGVEERATSYVCSRSLFAALELSIHEISACSEQYYIGISSFPVKRCLGKRYFGQEVYDIPGHCESYRSMQVLVHGDARLIALLEVAHLLLRLGIDMKCDNIGKGGERRGQADTWSSLYIAWNPKANSTQSLEDMIE